ncbi:MAG: uracil-DNA glycosylase family protein [Halolamina sp.]
MGAEEPAFPVPDAALPVEPGCERCPALADCRNRIAWGNGPPDADVFVVGEAPGAGSPDAEDWRGGNWTGLAYTAEHSGRRIRETMAAAGYPDSFYTNAVKCFPADPEDPTTNREPTATERENCRAHLRTELDAVAPAAVVATGKHATASMLAFENERVEGFIDSVLESRWLSSLDVTLVPVLHPSYRDVWLSRLDQDLRSYREELSAVLDEAVADDQLRSP